MRIKMTGQYQLEFEMEDALNQEMKSIEPSLQTQKPSELEIEERQHIKMTCKAVWNLLEVRLQARRTDPIQHRLLYPNY